MFNISTGSSSSSASSSYHNKERYTKEEWEKKLSEVNISKSDLNKLVMNYLVIEGYKEAAEMFQQESGTKSSVDLPSIVDRMAIRSAIQRGDIEQGIEIVNDLNPEILDTNPQLCFHLQQQRLIELIKKGKLAEAIQFAQEELAPHCEDNPKFLEELERTMTLLVFEDLAKSPLADLVDNSQRQKTASELNAAILVSQSQDKDPKLPTILKMLNWAQAQLEEKCIYPNMKNLVTGEFKEEADS
ncbi:hypothetical protein SAMD00019534_034390 [Acytostelium subglobosum LB1]|uniref:hypothetical protein n=1 Tax=Acytostelium subglobosum LB1 TaxID=1410327 RepID=UPI000644C383|nr:hypothetical protein SAMD00019534_034390 [Acytostelium subglobosum LB1]GAM20264.1 hypothetical protein SAMD00019534_034390 [Acytostelium subglobosum LB1]|eukprot:XP_012759785.1 hypothetical protein SAMD00019534_034390 [Acytostelium subglobosum LB1]